MTYGPTTGWDRFTSDTYRTHPDIRPEEQHRLVPRVADGPTIVFPKVEKADPFACFPLVPDDEVDYPKQAEPPASSIDTRASVLDEAKEVIKERGENYDHPLPNHQRIAALWSVILGAEVTPLQVVQCMIAVKLARLIVTPEHRDSWVDIIGYSACAEKLFDSTRDA